MPERRPRFQLQDFYADASAGEPRLYELSDVPLDWSVDRRSFLVAAAAGTAILGGLSLPVRAAAPALKPAAAIQAHAGPVKGVAFNGTGSYLVSGSVDMSVKIWEMPLGRLHKVQAGKSAVHCVTVSPGGEAVYGDADKTIRSRQLPEGILGQTLRVWAQTVLCVDCSPDGKYLASGTDDGAIQLWDLAAGRRIKTLTGHRRPVGAVAFSPDGQWLASAASDSTVGLYDIPQGLRRQTLRGHGAAVDAVAWSPDGRRLFSGGADETIRTWGLPDGAPGPVWKAHGTGVGVILCSPDGRRVASGGADRLVKLWSTDTGQPVKTLSGHEGAVNCLAYSPDGRVLASGADDKTIRLWDAGTGEYFTNLFDPATLDNNREAQQYTWTNQYGQTITYTLPCGSPIPAGCVCTCNCVPGTILVPVPRPSGNSYCSCVPVCTCVPIK